jgi:nucleotide-binding universal stress UspA family protein
VRWERVLCGVDFSPASRRALHEAARLARSLEAELVLLYVQPVPTYPLPDGALPVGQEVVTRVLDQAEEALATWRHEAEAEGPRAVRGAVAMGDAASEILDYARDWHCDLIVVGSHGHGGLRRLILGSVAEKLVRASALPVLTVPPS